MSQQFDEPESVNPAACSSSCSCRWLHSFLSCRWRLAVEQTTFILETLSQQPSANINKASSRCLLEHGGERRRESFTQRPIHQYHVIGLQSFKISWSNGLMANQIEFNCAGTRIATNVDMIDMRFSRYILVFVELCWIYMLFYYMRFYLLTTVSLGPFVLSQ